LLAKLGEANQELYGRRKQDAAARINVLTDDARAAGGGRGAGPCLTRRRNWPCSSSRRRNWPIRRGEKIHQRAARRLGPAGGRGANYFSAGQYDKAEADYLKILQRDPNNGWCWPTWRRLNCRSRASWTTRRRTSPPPRAKSERRLQPFDSGLPEIPPGKIRRRARRVEPRGEAGSAKIRKSKIISASRWPQGPARAGGNGVAQGDSARPQLRRGAQQSRRDLPGPDAAAGRNSRAGIIKRRSTPASRAIPTWKNARRQGRAGQPAVKKWMTTGDMSPL
jgi:tetratricopeptide (TPR) repeat protein